MVYGGRYQPPETVRRPETVGSLFGVAGARFWRLLGASLVYAFGIVIGLLLLIVPILLFQRLERRQLESEA